MEECDYRRGDPIFTSHTLDFLIVWRLLLKIPVLPKHPTYLLKQRVYSGPLDGSESDLTGTLGS